MKTIEINEAEFFFAERDHLPEGFISLMRENMPAYSTHFGLISEPTENHGRYYIILKDQDDNLSLCSGLYEIDGHHGKCQDFDWTWEIQPDIFENFFYERRWPAIPVSLWEHETIVLQETVPYVTIADMNLKIRGFITDRNSYEFFHTDDWSPEFYRTQAKLGFIAISDYCGEDIHLMPQLQNFYAVLDWPNLRADKKVRKIMNSSRIRDEDISLKIDPDPEAIMEKLAEAWTPTWLHSKYISLMKELATIEEQNKDPEFKVWGVSLTVGKEQEIAAGELGYSVGKIYTSLSGYFNREKKEYNNFGKLQMVLLAEALQKAGAAFWNLGHPFMDYKTALGAQVLPRSVFLNRWDEAAAGKALDLNQTR